MKIILSFIIIFLACICGSGLGQDAIEIERVVTFTPGNGRDEIAMSPDQTGLDFQMSSNEDFYLLDFINYTVRVFSRDGVLKSNISFEDEKIERIHIYEENLILLTHDAKLIVMSLDNEIYFFDSLNISKPQVGGTYFYENKLFIPRMGWSIFHQDLIGFEIVYKDEDILGVTKVEVNEIGRISNSYDVDRSYQYWPFEKEIQPYFRKMKKGNYLTQTKDYIILRSPYARIESIYYLFSKNDKTFKKIGILPERERGEIYPWWPGQGHNIYDSHLYILGVKYSKERIPDVVRISKIDLSQFDDYPAVEPKWQGDSDWSPYGTANIDSIFSPKRLKTLSLRGLKILRNEVFARYGRKFKTPWLQEHFEKQPWYEFNPNYSDNLLTDTDLANIKLVKNLEKEKAGGK